MEEQTLMDSTPRTRAIDPLALSALGLLNDLRHAAYDALAAKHKLPGLLLLYAFIDICASLYAPKKMRNRQTFESYLNRFYHPGWSAFTPTDLWAARSSLVHSFSPLGDFTAQGKARPIFYYAHPETPQVVSAALVRRGYDDFLLLNIEDIKGVAMMAFNAFWAEVEREPSTQAVFLSNAKHLLKDLDQMALEEWLVLVDSAATQMGLR